MSSILAAMDRLECGEQFLLDASESEAEAEAETEDDEVPKPSALYAANTEFVKLDTAVVAGPA